MQYTIGWVRVDMDRLASRGTYDTECIQEEDGRLVHATICIRYEHHIRSVLRWCISSLRSSCDRLVVQYPLVLHKWRGSRQPVCGLIVRNYGVWHWIDTHI